MTVEYIPRDLVLLVIEKVFEGTDPKGEEQIGILKCHRVVREHPAADVAPVVRCKDCKHYTAFDAHNCKRLEFHFCNKFGNITRESDFCSYGERKQE